MRARIKATGEIVGVSMECNNSTDFRKATFRTKYGMCYRYNEIELTFDKIKARVKSTGDIFEVSDTTTIYPEHYDKSYNITEVEFLDVKEKSFPKDNNYFYLDFLISSIIAKMPASTTLIAIIIIVDLSGVLRLNRACAPANPKKKYFNRITYVFL